MYILYSVTSEVDSYGHRANHRELILHIYLKENKKKHTRTLTTLKNDIYCLFLGKKLWFASSLFSSTSASLALLARPSFVADVLLSFLLFHFAPCWHREEDEPLLGGLFVALVCRRGYWLLCFVGSSFFSIRTYLNIDVCVLTRIWSYFLECSSF